MRRVPRCPITGSQPGIGPATAAVLAERVVSGGRQPSRQRAAEQRSVAEAIRAAGGEAVGGPGGRSPYPLSVARMAGDVERRWGGVDVLVHNALIPFAITSFAELTWEQLGETASSNQELHAAFLMTRKAVVPGMISPRLRSAGLPQHGVVPPAPADGVIPHWAPRQGGAGPSSSGTSRSSWRRAGSLRQSPSPPATVEGTRVAQQLTHRSRVRGLEYGHADGTTRPA